MPKPDKILAFLLLLLVSACISAQEKGTIFGIVKDQGGTPVEVATISVEGHTGTITDFNGKFELEVPANQRLKVIISHLEYGVDTIRTSVKPGERREIKSYLTPTAQMIDVIYIEDKYERANSMTRIPPKTIKVIPSVSQGIESILIGQIGVAKGGGELSSQYSVRGGNFDENLVYVNDIEVYRPFLIRSGQQEGLSFTNPDMVSSVLFSAGGFEARYGDKMSSVLDIKYRKPSETAGSFSASLLGGTAHIEGCSDNHRLTFISGFRYKSSQYLLKSLDTKGEYKPSFGDFQTYITYDVTTDFELSFLANIAQNKYTFVPETLETAFGTWDEALNLKIYFDGHEVDQFTTATGAISGNYHPTDNQSYKLIASGYKTREMETYDIQGQYFINELDRDLSSEDMGDSLMNIGIGTFLNHARNYLNASVASLSHKAIITNEDETNVLQWGAKLQHEEIVDEMNEWQMLDSAGYSLPYSESAVNLYQTLFSDNALTSTRISGYIQNAHNIEKDSNELNLTFGIRGSYWDLNRQFIVSPRLNVGYKPNWKKDFLFRFAAGYYYQPPFYKELRDLEGNINKDVKAQKSIHFVLGSDYNFMMWGRPFKYITEIYFKKLDDLVPYLVDQVRIRYYADNIATGYVAGVDMKINGEFVKGVDSWASISVMRSMENLVGDSVNSVVGYYVEGDSKVYYDVFRVEQGNVPRPSDQIVNFGLFFQDYIPKHPSWKVHLSLMFGTGLPFGPPQHQALRTAFRMPPYRRVDIGFSKELLSEKTVLPENSPFRYFKNIWISAEVFNLLDINNTISYLWVTDIQRRQLAVPNYLTSRRLNVKLIVRF